MWALNDEAWTNQRLFTVTDTLHWTPHMSNQRKKPCDTNWTLWHENKTTAGFKPELSHSVTFFWQSSSNRGKMPNSWRCLALCARPADDSEQKKKKKPKFQTYCLAVCFFLHVNCQDTLRLEPLSFSFCLNRPIIHSTPPDKWLLSMLNFTRTLLTFPEQVFQKCYIISFGKAWQA